MMTKNLNKTTFLFVVFFFIYSMNKLIFSYVFEIKSVVNFKYSLEKLHIIFASFSFFIFLILKKVKQKNLDIVGYAFLLITSIKMIACYVIVRPILEKEPTIEKLNFFILFIIYLFLETIITIKLLNEK